MHYPVGPIIIGMPQLGPYGLSENWLLRHVGDLHWRTICGALGESSRDIADEHGNRLYATFVRAAWSATKPLSSVGESDTLDGWMEMVRCNDSLFISQTSLTAAGQSISLRMASIFSRREKSESNDRLLSAAPLVSDQCSIPLVEEIPPFLVEHRLLRSNRLETVTFAGQEFRLDSSQVAREPYQLNGYFDFNGANLLYFASYPTIADICLSRSVYIDRSVGFARFVSGCSPMGRDIFYFGNANIDDTVVCAIALERDSSDLFAYRVDLIRAKDGECISRQFVLRESLTLA